MRRLLVAAFVGTAMAGPVLAQIFLVASKPGLMCTSSDALAVLTAPGGGSRIGTPGEKPGDQVLRTSGGCLDIPQGATVRASSVRKQTSIIAFDGGDGRGDRQFFVPNADFSPPGPADAPDPNGQCQALGTRMAQRNQLPGPVTNTQEFGTWHAVCSENPPTGPGLVDLLCEGDVPHQPGSAGRMFFWQKHAGTRISTGSMPCAG